MSDLKKIVKYLLIADNSGYKAYRTIEATSRDEAIELFVKDLYGKVLYCEEFVLGMTIPMPDTFELYNGSTTPCSMLIGTCSCTSYHSYEMLATRLKGKPVEETKITHSKKQYIEKGAEEYFEMATANTIKTRPTVCAEECLALMNDYALSKVKEAVQNHIDGKCECTPDERPGSTLMWACNLCGKETDEEFDVLVKHEAEKAVKERDQEIVEALEEKKKDLEAQIQRVEDECGRQPLEEDRDEQRLFIREKTGIQEAIDLIQSK